MQWNWNMKTSIKKLLQIKLNDRGKRTRMKDPNALSWSILKVKFTFVRNKKNKKIEKNL